MAQVHEKSSMDESEMSAIIRAAREQSLDRSKTKRHTVTPTTQNIPESTDIKTAEHGSYIQTDDGVGAIVVDHEVELQKQQENDETGKALLNLLDPNSLVTNANQYIPDYGKNVPKDYDPGVQFIKENPYDPKTKQLKEIKADFAKLVPGMNGLVSADSEEGRLYAEAIHKLETGEIVLPTPEEYEQQKKEAEEKRERERQKRREEAKQGLKSDNNPPKEINKEANSSDEPTMGDMPENAIMKKGVDDLMNALENQNNSSNPVIPDTTTTTRIQVQDNAPVETNGEVGVPVQIPTKQQNTPKTFNLAEAEQELKEHTEGTSENTPEQIPEENQIKPSEVVTINVPKGEAETVIEHLPLDTYDKVTKAKLIKVNEIEMKDVPTATSRITDLAAYKRLSNRRPKIKTAEVTERVLINSGFIVTLKGATSLEMATIFTSPTSSDIDWEKEYIFCYEHTVGTSIGKLSYNDYIVRVSPKDIETILDGIYEISETDTRKVSIICGVNDGGCGQSYDIDCRVSDLPDLDSLDKEATERIKLIVEAKGSIDESKRIANDSPTAIVKHIQCGDRVVNIRQTTGAMMIERIDMIDSLAQRYGAIASIFLLFVESISITIQEREDVAPQTFLIDTPDLICQEILTFDDEELQCVKDVITEKLVEYAPMTYSIKGPCTCPNCGNVKEKIGCSISDLVFQKAQSVLA